MRPAFHPLGHLPVTVPGTVDGWFQLHQRFGSLPMASVLAPAIRYARDGFPVSPVIAYYFKRAEAAFNRRLDMIDEFDNANRTYFNPMHRRLAKFFVILTWPTPTPQLRNKVGTPSMREALPKP